MRNFAILLVAIILFATSDGIKNYMGTDIQKCFNCMCHARTGCFSRFNCADYSINYEYWKTAKSPVVNVDDEPETQQSFDKCMKNENCILATLDQYADAIGHMDCNCDGQFDCKDRFAIHLYGSKCARPKFLKIYVQRFNSCHKQVGVNTMETQEGAEGCTPEVFKDV